MKFKNSIIITIIVIIILLGYNSTKKVSIDNLKITPNDENTILEYLDKKTNDIAYSKKGKMYSSFKLLGADKNKLYIWALKVEFFKVGDKITHENGDAVSLPMILKIKKNGTGFSIISYKCPKEGDSYGKSMKKLFPSNIKFADNDKNEMLKLYKITEKRAEENFTKDF